MSPREQPRDGQPVSVDDTIDDVAHKALEEARRREELKRLRERDNPGGDRKAGSAPTYKKLETTARNTLTRQM